MPVRLGPPAAANQLQMLRYEVLEKIRSDTDILLQGQLAEALSLSPGMISAVLSGRANFRLRDALKLHELCPSIGLGWVYFLSPSVHESLTTAIEDFASHQERPKPK